MLLYQKKDWRMGHDNIKDLWIPDFAACISLLQSGQVTYLVCHEKTDLKVFVVVIPKEGWAHVAMPILLLVWHRLSQNMIYEVKRLKSFGYISKRQNF